MSRPWYCPMCDKPYKIVMGRANDEMCMSCARKEQHEINFDRRTGEEPDERTTDRDLELRGVDP